MTKGKSHTEQDAFSYTRVSSAAQVKRGHGAESQAVRCEEFARIKGLKVIKTYSDKGVSGSLVDRPQMKRMLSDIRKHPADIVYVIVDDISRLARGLEAHLALRAAIAEVGGVLISPSIEFGEDSDSQLIEHLLASVSQHARVKNAEQTRNRMEARLRQGYWPFKNVLGYKYQKIEGHGKLLVPDEPIASIIKEALIGYKSGLFQTIAEVARFLTTQPDFPKNRFGVVTNEAAKRILTRLLYAGMIEKPEWGISLRQGKHEGLISFEDFEVIAERLKGKAYAPVRKNLNEDFVLRGAVACADCSNPMTACWSKSKTGAKHAYYMCFKKGCESYRKSIRRDKLEGDFETLLGIIKPRKKFYGMACAMFERAWDGYGIQAREAAKSIKLKLAQADQQIEKLLDRIVETSSDSAIGAYERKLEKLEREKLVLTEKLESAGKPTRPFREMFELALNFFENPCKHWENGKFEDRQTLIRLLFRGRLKYSRNEGFRTPKTSIVFKVLDAVNPTNILMAERQGFEPWRACAQHAFQACALNRSATAPDQNVCPIGLSAAQYSYPVARRKKKGIIK